MAFINSYIFGTEEKKKMPSLSSKDIQQSEPLMSVVETEPIIEKKKELTLIDLVNLPENKELCLCFEAGCGEWIISDRGKKLSRVSKDTTIPRIDSYWCTYSRGTGEIGYFMTAGHTFLIGCCEKGIKITYTLPGQCRSNYNTCKQYEWRKV